jgi:hypothetical protein
MVSWIDVLPIFLSWTDHTGRQPAEGLWGPRRGSPTLPIPDVAMSDFSKPELNMSLAHVPFTK